MNYRKRINIAGIVWTGSLLLRKLDLPLSGLLLLLTSILLLGSLSLGIYRSYRSGEDRRVSLSLVLYFLGCALVLPRIYSSIQEQALAVAGCILLVTGLFLNLRSSEKIVLRENAGIILLSVFGLLSALLPGITLHHLLRASTYESYVTRKFPEGSETAEQLLRKAVTGEPGDKEKAVVLQQTGYSADSSGNAQDALFYYNQSLELDPFNPLTLLCRGRLQLTRFELSEEQAGLALRDLTRAVRYNPLSAEAWYYKAQADYYLDRKETVCEDVHRCTELDTAYTAELEHMRKKFCGDSGSSVPAK